MNLAVKQKDAELDIKADTVEKPKNNNGGQQSSLLQERRNIYEDVLLTLKHCSNSLIFQIKYCIRK